MKFLISISAFLITIVAFAQTQSDTNQLEGYWTLEGIEGELRSFHLSRIESDGSFIEVATDSTQNILNDTKAIGVWTYNGFNFLPLETDKHSRRSGKKSYNLEICYIKSKSNFEP